MERHDARGGWRARLAPGRYIFTGHYPWHERAVLCFRVCLVHEPTHSGSGTVVGWVDLDEAEEPFD